MNYLTICSGTEAFGRAWKRLGFRCVGHAEIAKHPAAVLRYHYPTVRNYDDFTSIQAHDTARVDLLAGGTPCQDFSVAGLRAGLAGDKGNLTLQFLLLLKRLGSRWVVWENVPGVFSADGGAAFGRFLAGLSELGYGVAYRTLDAQHFGVPQRRRRVFVVAYLGDWRPAAAVLFEPESLRGDSAPGRQSGQDVANTITTGVGNGGQQEAERGMLVWDEHGRQLSTGTVEGGSLHLTASNAARMGNQGPVVTADPSPDHLCRFGFGTCAFVGEADLCAQCEDGSQYEEWYGPQPPVYQCHGGNVGEMGTLRTGSDVSSGVPFTTTEPLAFGWSKSPSQTMRVDTITDPILAAKNSQPAVLTAPLRYGPSQQDTMHFEEGVMNTLCVGSRFNSSGYTKTFTQPAVRRLTPRECERLMGWPDDWTRYGAKPDGTIYEVADGPRYEMCGNGWAAPVAEWIGERVMLVEQLMREEAPTNG